MITANENVRSNVAYDYERFERRPAVRKPELEVVQTRRAERVAADRQRLALLRTVSMLLVTLLFIKEKEAGNISFSTPLKMRDAVSRT